ncbi:MAG: cytochrome oxidase subunit III [Saprospiraceae bacterium]|nr:cytochrome oxidase subunit III [Saprospiraceae bacterium]HMW39846.1 cytochrome oxidase subunit III [Saprospiraceae bacterium]HMX88990.1 cytochrome oxidase subunit III [Saprospiraceae bacterium]HMZ40841.1 cytochrome oxidase subunit III [Saprospiraceae bacterium]HNA65208.1 cytochrome oxidase subunit III [Saprospiraceae bacterium]
MPVVQIFDKELAPSKIQALKFGLWIGMASIVMLFGAFTSAYLVRKPVGNWYEFKLPIQFFYSTLIIIGSSVLLEKAFKSFRSHDLKNYQLFMFISFFAGIAFLATQVIAFKAMISQGLFIDLNVSVSFLYVLAGMHALHVIGGIIVMIISLTTALAVRPLINEMNILKLDLLRQYWHFVGALWIYLLIFLILQ